MGGHILILGGTGRLAALMRPLWPTDDHVTWQGRGSFDDHVSAAKGARAILCLAGVTPTRAAQGAHLQDNVGVALDAIRVAQAAHCPRVFLASSAAVYGRAVGVMREQDTPHPVSDYGRSKLEMERLAADLAQETDVKVTSLRIGNVAGADAILGGWCSGFLLDVFDDSTTPRRSYVGPGTLSRVLHTLSRARELPPVINIAAPGPVEMGALLDAAGLPWTPRTAPSDAIREVALSTEMLEGFVSFGPQDVSVQTMVAQWRAATGEMPE